MKYECNLTIDKLKLCYLGNDTVLSQLSQVEIGGYYDTAGFRFYRLVCGQFRYCFDILRGDKKLAQLKFGHLTDPEGEDKYVYYKIENETLYKPDLFLEVLMLPEELDLIFNNFTSLDIALDSTFNYSRIIKKMIRNRSLTTIINGKRIKDRKRVRPELKFDYSTSLERLKYPTFTIRQVMALKHSNQGIEIQAYDKKNEIENYSHKTYILDYYHQPKTLHRLEVRLKYIELRDYFKKVSLKPNTRILLDKDRLMDLFLYHLYSVLRFRNGRKLIPWEDILKMHSQDIE